jgi:hypothetical protein
MPIRLKDQRANKVVAATLHVGLTEDQVRSAQNAWEQERKDGIKQLLQQGWKLEELPKHWGWNWTRKISRLPDPLLAFCGVECNGQMQGMMEMAKEGYLCKLPDQKGKPLVYVKYVETAPWNIRLLNPNPMYGGIGSRLMRVAIDLSNAEGYKGRIGLHSLPGKGAGQPEWFYEHVCHMEPVETERNAEGLLYFEMTENEAITFLNGGKP